MISKIAVINGTYQLMRISGLTKDAGPEENELALQVADDYAAQLKAEGLDVGWQQPSEYGESDPSDTSGLIKETAGPFKKLLMMELAPYFGKEIPPTVFKIAEEGRHALEQMLITVAGTSQPSTLPFGSGNEWGYRDRKFYDEPLVNADAIYVFKDEVLNYNHDFSDWLVDDTLKSVTWESTDIAIGTDTFTDTVASAELTFPTIGGYSVQITATRNNSTDVKIINKNFIIDEARPTGLRFP